MYSQNSTTSSYIVNRISLRIRDFLGGDLIKSMLAMYDDIQEELFRIFKSFFNKEMFYDQTLYNNL